MKYQRLNQKELKIKSKKGLANEFSNLVFAISPPGHRDARGLSVEPLYGVDHGGKLPSSPDF